MQSPSPSFQKAFSALFTSKTKPLTLPSFAVAKKWTRGLSAGLQIGLAVMLGAPAFPAMAAPDVAPQRVLEHVSSDQKNTLSLNPEIAAQLKEMMSKTQGAFCAPIAATGSMKPLLDEHWVVVMAPLGMEEVVEGDIIARAEGAKSTGSMKVVLHRAVSVANGVAVTKGDNRRTEDFKQSDATNHLGIMVGAINIETGKEIKRWNVQIGHAEAVARIDAIVKESGGKPMTVPSKDNMGDLGKANVVVAPVELRDIRRNDVLLVEIDGQHLFRRARSLRNGGVVVKADAEVYNELVPLRQESILGVIVAYADPLNGRITERAPETKERRAEIARSKEAQRIAMALPKGAATSDLAVMAP